jgi:phage baseplate assembly protein W
MNIGTWLIIDEFSGSTFKVPGQLDLGATGLNEVLQNVGIILTTRIGTVMLDRRFGLTFKYLDAPQNQAQLIIIQDVCMGIARFEPRVTFKTIQFDINSATLAMDVTLSIQINANELTLPSN